MGLNPILTTLILLNCLFTVFHEDHARALKLCHNDKVTARTKHVDMKFHHFTSLVKRDVVNPTHLSIHSQKADILTKRIGAVKFPRNRPMLVGE